jgi:hypothetical protein
VHVKDDAIDRPVEPSSQIVGVVPPVRPRLANRNRRLEELAVLWTEGEHEPVLDPRHLLVREATVESHSAGAKASDRLGDEVWHTAIMPHEPHSYAADRALVPN